MPDLARLTVHEAGYLLRRREISAVDLAEDVLAQIDQRDPTFHAYITVTADLAREQARAADRRIAAGEDGPLLGIPYALKDNMCVAGVRTTAGSRILESFVPPYDSTVARRLRDAGAVLVGKTNLDEFAMGSSTEYSAFSPTRNPRDPSRVPGGSSGGSAAAVAADECLFALGSDTGGSVRLPAAFCGVVGLKPTYGRVSRFGLIAFASSLDQIGPLTKDVADCALVLGAIAGHEPADSTSLNHPVPGYSKALGSGSLRDGRPLRVGVPREYFVAGMQPGVESRVREAIERLAALGAEIEETSLPHTRYALDAYYVIAPAEASANLARYDGVKYGLSAEGPDAYAATARTRAAGFGPEVKRRIMLGTYALSSGYYDAYYLRAQRVRTLVKRDFDAAFATFDVLAVPTAPTVAFPLGERIDDPLEMYLTDVCTVTANIAGLPGLVIPCGEANGLPVGLQLIGPAGGEATLLRAGYALERSAAASGWSGQIGHSDRT
jgi:aspartyl-tRNA(Asn)/glutamyl-tRNA(Gln) amidotransferase subunit A